MNIKKSIKRSIASLSIPIPYYHVATPKKCEKLKSIVNSFGGSVEFQSYDAKIEYSLPEYCSKDIRSFLSQYTPSKFRQEFIARLSSGRVFGPGVVISPDGKSIARDVSLCFGRAFDEHWLLNLKRIRRPRIVNGISVVIAASFNNYYHWLFDELPRLLTVNKAELDSIIWHTSSQYNRDALKLYQFSGNILQVTRNSHFQCEQLIVPTLVGKSGTPTPKAVNSITKFAEPLYKKITSFGDLIYVSREKAKRRRVSNEEELWSQLQFRGFKKILLEQLTWQEQINLFRNAKVIVAPHGAGLANLVFCRSGTKVVEFFNRSYVNPCFWKLATIKGLDYRPVVPSSEEPLSRENNELDLVADCKQIMMSLSE